MKAKIKRKMNEEGGLYFAVYAISNFQTKPIDTFSFRIDEPEGSIYNEKVNFEAAMKLAKTIESINDSGEELVYETGKGIIKPNNNE
jgi:hypothetical protein